jgi:molybdopterin-binding protein
MVQAGTQAAETAGATAWLSQDCCYNSSMALSARNQLPGTIEDIQIGDIMAHVVVKVGNNVVESVITRNSAEELRLKKGDAIKIVVKSTEVMIQKD